MRAREFKFLHLYAEVGIKTTNVVYFALLFYRELFLSACRTHSTLTFPRLTNQILISGVVVALPIVDT